MSLPKVLAIVGPTASGKSDLAVELALLFNGEVISADSRQVYKGLDLGTGKITQEEMRGVPHHLLDVAKAETEVYTAERFKQEGKRAIEDILTRGKLPIVCGGTGFYIKQLLYDIDLPPVPPNPTLRAELEKEEVSRLFEILRKKDPERARSIDRNNKVKIIRALEIIEVLGKVPPAVEKTVYDLCTIGINTNIDDLRKRIRTRLLDRIHKGMIEEIEALHKQGLSWERMYALGLEYRMVSEFLQKKITKEEMIERLTLEIGQYAKRQITWFKEQKGIHWLALSKKDEMVKLVESWLQA